jgi:hypothetical protein
MIDWSILREQTLGFRRAIAGMLEGEGRRAGIRPPTWNNNLHWHAGHLITTPRILTYGLMGEPIGVPEEYRKWFAKGSSPADWGDDPVPSFEELAGRLVDVIPPLFDAFEARADEPFPRPYPTSVGVLLRTPAEALSFSLAHDGTHMGMIQALRRGLNGIST